MGGALAQLRNGFHLDVLLWTGITTVLLQILSNFSNDYGDSQHGADNEERIGPARAVQSGAISHEQMKKAIILMGLLSFIAGITTLYLSGIRLDLTGLFYLVLGISAIAAAIKYTAGENPYGYKGKGDLFVFLFFGIVGVLGSTALHDLELPSWLEMLPAVSIGLLCAGVLNLNNMRDRLPDERAGKHTLAVKLGAVASRRYHNAIITIGLLSMLLFSWLFGIQGVQWLYLIAFPSFIMHLLRVRRTEKDEDLDPELKRLALSTFFMALIFLISSFY
jgi:1,4-dihydroxy-2-naphthoate octaprenyltransferase